MIPKHSAPLSMRASKRIAGIAVAGALVLFLALSCAKVGVESNRATVVHDGWGLDVVLAPSGTLERIYIKGPDTAKFANEYTVRTGVYDGHPWINIYRNETQY